MLEAHRPFPKLQFHNQLRLLEAQLDVLWKQKPKSARRWCFPVTQYLFNFTVCIVLWSTYIYQWKDFRWISPPSWLCKKKRFTLPSGKLVTTTVHDIWSKNSPHEHTSTPHLSLRIFFARAPAATLPMVSLPDDLPPPYHLRKRRNMFNPLPKLIP